MAGTTRKLKPLSKPSTLVCLKCGQRFDSKSYYGSNSPFFRTYRKIPYCKDCLDELYEEYYKKYKGLGYNNPDRKAVERVCMITDQYYSDKIFDSAAASYAKDDTTSIILYYLRNTRLRAYLNKTYEDTLNEKTDDSKNKDAIISIYNDDDVELDKRVREGQKLFGSGFDREDYVFLYDQYSDWTARHECNTKSQEELFKQICFTQLDLFKANRSGRDTKALNDTLIKQLDAAKLQPKQNAGDTTADNQTLGTLIDKWENTRPIPEIDEELRDVDKIGRYISVFFFGHLCKMIGVDNDYARQYEEYMNEYTVDRPEYAEDDADEAIYHAMFGGDVEDE